MPGSKFGQSLCIEASMHGFRRIRLPFAQLPIPGVNHTFGHSVPKQMSLKNPRSYIRQIYFNGIKNFCYVLGLEVSHSCHIFGIGPLKPLEADPKFDVGRLIRRSRMKAVFHRLCGRYEVQLSTPTVAAH